MTNHLETVKEHILEIWQEVEKTLWIENPKKTLKSLTKANELALKFCKPEKIKLGHIAAFQKNKETEIHRIVGFWNKGSHLFFLTQKENLTKIHLTEQSILLGRITAIKAEEKTLSLKSPARRLGDFASVLAGWTRGLFSIFSSKD